MSVLPIALDIQLIKREWRRVHKHRARLSWDILTLVILGRQAKHALVHADGLNVTTIEGLLNVGKPPRPRPYGLLMEKARFTIELTSVQLAAESLVADGFSEHTVNGLGWHLPEVPSPIK